MAEDPTDGGGQLPAPALERMAEERPTAVYEDEPLSLLSLLEGKLRDAVLRVSPEMQRWDEKELATHGGVSYTRTDHALRASFWREYDKACALGRERITVKSIIAGICSETYFYERFLNEPARVAWMVLPHSVYAKEMEAILHRGTQRLWELMEMPIRDKDGRVDPRRAEALLKVIQEVQNRVRGMAVQRVEKKEVSLQMKAPSTKAIPVESMEDLQRRLTELEGARPATLTLPSSEPVDVVVVTATKTPVAAE